MILGCMKMAVHIEVKKIMARFNPVLPDIDYASGFNFPPLSNSLADFTDLFPAPDQRFKVYRYGTQSDGQPFHCFVDDFRLEAIWRHKDKKVDSLVLSPFAVLPDFTVETNYPLPYAFYQVWRSRVIGAWWASHGLYVIPTLQWGDPNINPFLFLGLEACQVVAVRSPSKGSYPAWYHGVRQFLDICQPQLVLHFGMKAGIDVWPNAMNLNLR